jgi:PncC family amidohydrolase
VRLEERLGAMLRERGLSLALAESCTGGLIASRVTDVPGSSSYFLSGIVTYSNEAKEKFLGVSTESITTHGAVSKEVAEQMAQGIRRATGADIGISVTGIAGPTGGSPEKPVGLVYIGVASAQGAFVRRCQFTGNRLEIKTQTVDVALQLAIDLLEGDLAAGRPS